MPGQCRLQITDYSVCALTWKTLPFFRYENMPWLLIHQWYSQLITWGDCWRVFGGRKRCLSVARVGGRYFLKQTKMICNTCITMHACTRIDPPAWASHARPTSDLWGNSGHGHMCMHSTQVSVWITELLIGITLLLNVPTRRHAKPVHWHC